MQRASGVRERFPSVGSLSFGMPRRWASAGAQTAPAAIRGDGMKQTMHRSMKDIRVRHDRCQRGRFVAEAGEAGLFVPVVLVQNDFPTFFIALVSLRVLWSGHVLPCARIHTGTSGTTYKAGHLHLGHRVGQSQRQSRTSRFARKS